MTQSNAEPVELSTLGQEINEEFQSAIRSDASVLISGDDRCGKDVLARLIHRLGGRREGPFIAIDCAAGDSLVGGLFGEGSLFVRARTGTVFLDRVGELTGPAQAEFVRFLDLGADVRIIAASSHNLYEEVGAERFREDLFYRLNVIHIVLPAPSTSASGLQSNDAERAIASEELALEKPV